MDGSSDMCSFYSLSMDGSRLLRLKSLDALLQCLVFLGESSHLILQIEQHLLFSESRAPGRLPIAEHPTLLFLYLSFVPWVVFTMSSYEGSLETAFLLRFWRFTLVLCMMFVLFVISVLSVLSVFSALFVSPANAVARVGTKSFGALASISVFPESPEHAPQPFSFVEPFRRMIESALIEWSRRNSSNELARPAVAISCSSSASKSPVPSGSTFSKASNSSSETPALVALANAEGRGWSASKAKVVISSGIMTSGPLPALLSSVTA